jgi:hypothetical protein
VKQKSAERRFLAEAALHLIAAKIALRCIPAERLFARADRPLKMTRRFAADRAEWITWAVETVSRKRLLKSLCLPKALATHTMLRRAGIPSRLCLGVGRIEGTLQAHAWCETLGEASGDNRGFKLLRSFGDDDVGGQAPRQAFP